MPAPSRFGIRRAGAPVKIAQVTPYDVGHPGGVAEHIGRLRDEFVRRGHEVVVMAPRSEKGGLEVREGFYGIGRTVTIPGNGSKVRLTFDVTLYAAVKELMRREQFDLVHLHEPLIPVLPYMVLLNSRAVNVATFHAARDTNAWYTAFKPYMSFVLSRVDARIAVSEPAREIVSRTFEGPYRIIPNGVDLAHYNDAVAPFPWATDGTPRILFVGRFNETRKGFKHLLRALPMVRQQFPRARLVVVGTGDPEKFAGVIERDRIGGIDWIGFVSREDLPRYYASCDVFCAPSIAGESFGIVLLEAMASGRPVVAANIPGYAGVITNEREGLLVDPASPQALALGLVRMLSDAALRARLAAQGKVSAAHYAWPDVAERVLRVYEEASATAAAAPWRQS